MSRPRRPKAKCSVRGCRDLVPGEGKYCLVHSPRFAGSLEDRMMARVDKRAPDECWPWTGYINSTGYGMLRYGQQNLSAHRTIYELLVGPIEDGMFIDHACHNTRCVNPSHLRPLTPKQNVENFGGLRANNTSGFRGVSLHSSGLYAAQVTHRFQRHHIGYFRTAEAAGAAAQKARLELHTHNDLDRSA